MYYEINVSFNGIHFFATAPRSIDNDIKLAQVLSLFDRKFPESEGYKIMVELNPEVSQLIDLDEFKAQWPNHFKK